MRCAVSRRHDRMFVLVGGLPGRDQFLVFRLDRCGAGGRVDVARGTAEHRRAVYAKIAFGRAVDQQIAQRRQILDDDRRWHVLDDRVEERAGLLQIALGVLALGDILVRRHPAATRHRLVDHRDDAAVVQRDIHSERVPLLDRRAQLGA